MIDLFQPPKPVAIQGTTRRVLLMDARGEVTPDAGQLQPKRPSKFDGMTPEQVRAYIRARNKAQYEARKANPDRKAQVDAASKRYRARQAEKVSSNGAGRHAADSTLARVSSPDPISGEMRGEQ